MPNTLTDTSLASLIARVEGATEGSRVLFEDLALRLVGYGWLSDGWGRRFLRFTEVGAWESAALALVERVLPGWDIELERLEGCRPHEWFAKLGRGDGSSSGSTPALALLAALLKAVQAQASESPARDGATQKPPPPPLAGEQG